MTVFSPHLLILFLLFFLGFYLLWRIPSFVRCAKLLDRERTGIAPNEGQLRVSVIIPARNEEARIAPLLESLRQQILPPHEVLVVDDHSSDGTAGVASALGARLLQSQMLPEGWTGKTWACWQGAREASGDLLVFLDADVRLEREALACLVGAYGEKGGLLTVQPYHVTHRPYEELSAVFNIVLMAGVNAFTPHGEALSPSGGFGPCNLCSRADYAQTGGHSQPAVRGNVLESIPLARLFLNHELPVRCYGGRGAVSFRMYPSGLRELVEGWTKGFGSGALAVRPVFFVLIVAWISACFGAFASLAGALGTPGPWGLASHALVYGLYAIQMGWILRRIGRFRWWTAALFPVPLCFFALILLRSFILIYLLGRVQWRGREVATTRGRGQG